MDDTSNVREVERFFAELFTSWDFTSRGVQESLGRDLAAEAALAISDRTLSGIDASGNPFEPNDPKYAERKGKQYGWSQPLLRTGQLASLESMLGSVTITTDSVVMRYGTGTRPSSSKAPTGYFSKWDREVTDREKAEHNSERRPFFALDTTIVERLIEVAAEAWDKHVAENRGR